MQFHDYYNCRHCISHLICDFKLRMTHWYLSFSVMTMANNNMMNSPMITKITPITAAVTWPAV